MNRINVYAHHDEWEDLDQASYEAAPALLGWFDYDKAEKFHEDTEWNGSNHISVATGSQWDHEMLLRTAQGRWVLKTHSNRQGVLDGYRYIKDGEAREWLLRNNGDEEVAKYFVPVEDERGPGRPKVGEQVCFTVSPEDLAIIDNMAKQGGKGRSEVLRNAVAEFVKPVKAAIAETEMTPVPNLLVLCSYLMRPDAMAASDRCRHMADTAAQDAEGNLWWRCPAHRGQVRPGVPGEVVTSIPQTPETTPEEH